MLPDAARTAEDEVAIVDLALKPEQLIGPVIFFQMGIVRIGKVAGEIEEQPAAGVFIFDDVVELVLQAGKEIDLEPLEVAVAPVKIGLGCTAEFSG